MAGIVKGQAFTGQRGDADENFFAERAFGVLRNADLFLNRAHQLLIRLHFLIGDRVVQLALVAIRFDVIEVVVEQRACRLFIGVDKGSLYLFLRHFVVFSTRFMNKIQIAFPFLASDTGMLIKSIA